MSPTRRFGALAEAIIGQQEREIAQMQASLQRSRAR
jgi:uncharacterized protein (DUF305 family)